MERLRVLHNASSEGLISAGKQQGVSLMPSPRSKAEDIVPSSSPGVPQMSTTRARRRSSQKYHPYHDMLL